MCEWRFLQRRSSIEFLVIGSFNALDLNRRLTKLYCEMLMVPLSRIAALVGLLSDLLHDVIDLAHVITVASDDRFVPVGV